MSLHLLYTKLPLLLISDIPMMYLSQLMKYVQHVLFFNPNSILPMPQTSNRHHYMFRLWHYLAPTCKKNVWCLSFSVCLILLNAMSSSP